MVKLQHRDRRDGIVLVGGAKYELDELGCVEVTEEHSEKMLQGALWRPVGYWEAQGRRIAAVTPPTAQGGARRPRTRDEMMALAEASGIPVKEPAPEPAPTLADVISVPEPEPESEPETIEVSSTMKKSELVEVAVAMGLEVDGLTKAEILDLIEAQGE